MSKELQGLVVGLVAIIATIVLHQINNAGKNTPWVSAIGLVVIAALSLWCAFLVFPWIWHPRLVERVWRVSFVTAVVLLAVGRYGIWVWPPAQKTNTNRSSSAEKLDINPRPSRIAMLHDVFPSANGTKMLLIPFRNDSTSGQAYRFYAHIAYKRANGSEIAEIPRGTWFPTVGHPESASFPAKITRELAVLFLEDGKLLKPAIKWQVQSVFTSIVTYPETKHDEITEPIHTVEVTLIAGTRTLLPFVFDFAKNANGQPILKWRR